MFKISYIYDLVDNISPQLKKIQSNLEQVNNKVAQTAQSMSNSFNKIGDSLKQTSQSVKNIGSTLAPLSATMGLVGFKAISSASNFETLGIQLEILTGSAEKGKNLFQELAKYSAETPFELPEIVKATRTLLGSNIALKDVVATTKMLGDVSAGSGADISSLAVVYGQVAGMTKLQGQDAMQFVSNGIPIWALLQKQFEGIEPELSGMAKFAYLSQQHSIDAQVVGYETKTKEKLTPTQGGSVGGTEGGTQGGSVQEKEKEKGKEEVECTNTHPLVEYLNTNCPQVQGLATPINNLDAERLLVEFDKYDLVEVFMAMENTKQLKRKYNSANLTVRSWIKTRQKSNSTFGQIKQQNKVKAAWE